MGSPYKMYIAVTSIAEVIMSNNAMAQMGIFYIVRDLVRRSKETHNSEKRQTFFWQLKVDHIYTNPAQPYT